MPCYVWPWYISNGQIQEDLGVPLFADHVRAVTVSFYSRLPEVRNALVRQLGRYLRWTRLAVLQMSQPRAAWTGSPVQVIVKRWPSPPNETCCALSSGAPFEFLNEGFPWFFLSFTLRTGIFFLYINHKSLIQSKATFFFRNHALLPFFCCFIYCVIKCVKSTRVLKGKFASSVFQSRKEKTPKTRILVSGQQCVKANARA
jgi:hypothetical protein